MLIELLIGWESARTDLQERILRSAVAKASSEVGIHLGIQEDKESQREAAL